MEPTDPRPSTLTDDEILERAEAIQRRRAEARQRLADETDARVQELLRGQGAPFHPDLLRYAARERCHCGAGMAYPTSIGMHGAWHCSAILTGTARREVPHQQALPFAFWKVKAEGQPSAGGATTRPPTPCDRCGQPMDREEVRQGVPPAVVAATYVCGFCEG